jgi:3-dehydroquinate synthase
MADAAIGGKTAVNLPLAKNLVGAFWQPVAVYADIDTLATLPRERRIEGLAEVVKAAVVADAALFDWLERSAAQLVAGDPQALEHAVRAALAVKARIVRRDERETGRRAVLNFGHTVAHALEAASDYRLAHGAAVAVGMAVEARLAHEATGFPPRQLARLTALLEALELPVRPPPDIDFDLVVAASRHDKKARGGRTRYALPRRIGRMSPGADPTCELAEEALRVGLGEAARVDATAPQH